MNLIAINNGHGASIGYMEDGVVTFALQEERLTRIKNQAGFPHKAFEELLKKKKLSVDDVDWFVFTDQATVGIGRADQDAAYWREKFHSMFEPKTRTHGLKARQVIRKLLGRVPSIDARLRRRSVIREQTWRSAPLRHLGIPTERILFMDHHTCHASSAAYGWGETGPFAVITSDGIGDGTCGTVSVFEKGELSRKASIAPEGSIALIYAMVTYYLGMQPIEHEYKLMGMAPYGEDSLRSRAIADELRSWFVFNEDGLTYRPVKNDHARLLAPRLKKLLAYERFDHIAAGIQMFTEEFISEWIDRAIKTLGVRKVALSGGLFMNVKLNKRIMNLDCVDSVFVFPSCGDESNIFGACYRTYYEKTGKLPSPLSHLYLGGGYTDNEIEAAIKSFRFSEKPRIHKSDDINRETATLLATGNIVARFSGDMEFGARALGNRSIIANPTKLETIHIINKMIKSRDFWMPFAPSCITLDRYFINQKQITSPYMMFTFDTKVDKIKVARGAIHTYDQTARPQEVKIEHNAQYHALLTEFEQLTGENIVLNTSFNLHGYPIVYTPEDALDVFNRSGLRHLAIGNYLVSKNNL
jgi:carbamoyltransferase